MTFPLASMTKMYTATALVSLADEGKVDLQAPIGTYLQGLPARPATVTPHQMLSHTRADPETTPASRIGATTTAPSTSRCAPTRTASSSPIPASCSPTRIKGSTSRRHRRARIRPRCDSQVIQERIFTPLGMSRSTFTLATAVTFPFSQTHGGANGQAPVVIRPMAAQAPWPVGGMFSTMTDLAHYAVMFMNDGRYDGKQVIAANVVKRMVDAERAGAQPGRGRPARLRPRRQLPWRGVRLVEHGGTLAGSATDFVMVPDQHAAVIVFAEPAVAPDADRRCGPRERADGPRSEGRGAQADDAHRRRGRRIRRPLLAGADERSGAGRWARRPGGRAHR